MAVPERLFHDTGRGQVVATVVLGLGATGYACARYLYDAGVPFAIADTRDEPPLRQQMCTEMPEVAVYAGGLEPELFAGCQEIVVSPGIDPELPLLRTLQRQGTRIMSDIDLFQRGCKAPVKAPVVAVTGTNGKSTVASLLYAMAKEAGLDVAAGGNLGMPAVSLLHADRQLYVLELSSFQLQLSADTLCLDAACVLNVSLDHLDRHGGMQQYAAIKSRIYAGAKRHVVNLDDSVVAAEAAKDAWGFTLRPPRNDSEFGLCIDAGTQWLARGGQKIVARDQLPLPGQHNSANYLAALALGTAIDLPLPAMCKAMAAFSGLPHRTAQLAQHRGVRWINDSKATNPGAAAAAVRSLGGDNNLVLIAGGEAKHMDFSELAAAVPGKAHSVILLGAGTGWLEQALAGRVELLHATSMEAAVALAAARASSGDTVLLSPACASFDMYDDYRARGDAFAAALAKHIGESR